MVDKTDMIQYLLDSKRVVYRRPRRYGKTLTVSMLKYFFYGATKLFKGTKVFSKAIVLPKFQWSPSDLSAHCFPPRPVLHFDFSISTCHTKSDFENLLRTQMKVIGNSFCIPEVTYTSSGNDISNQLTLLIEELCRSKWNRWGNVVVLVDEYDSVLNRLDVSLELKIDVVSVIKSMFSTIKSKDSKIAFAYVTGITSYGMAGLYSGANNFVDLSHDPNLHSLCGFTEGEVRQVLGSMSEKEFSDLKDYYNGYSFLLEPKNKIPRVFNPVTINKYYNERTLKPYWGVSNSESLVKYFPRIQKIISTLPCSVPISILTAPIDYTSWNSTEVSSLAKLLLESGYLTVVDFDDSSNAMLDFPNQEIKSIVSTDLKSNVLLVSNIKLSNATSELNNGNLSYLLILANEIRVLSPFYHNIVYSAEASWHELITTILHCMHSDIKFSSEKANAYGRSDILILTRTGIFFVLELKRLDTDDLDKKSPKVQWNKLNAIDTYKGLAKTLALKGIQQIIDKSYLSSTFYRDNVRDIKSVQYASVVAVNSPSVKKFLYLVQQLQAGDPASQREHYF